MSRPDGVQVPSEIRHTLERTDDGLALFTGYGRVLPLLWAALAIIWTAGITSTAALAMLVATALPLPGIAGVGLVSALMVCASSLVLVATMVRAIWAHPIRLDPSGVRNMPFAWGATKPTRVIIQGNVGGKIQIVVVGSRRLRLLDKKPAASTPRGWTYDSMLWLAEQLAEQWGVPLECKLDQASWARWRDDPVFRGQVEFQRKIAASRRNHPKFHAQPPIEARPQYDHHGLRLGKMIIEDGMLRQGRGHVALVDISAVDVYFYTMTTGGNPPTVQEMGGLLVLTPWGPFRFGRRSASMRAAGALHGEAELLRKIVSEARPLDHGSPEAVPAGLRVLMTEREPVH